LTGRTHQIRVHLAHAGHPLLGDDKYGDETLNKSLRTKRLFLHAANLALAHPITKEPLSFKAPMPADMRAFVEARFS
ncbi:MAG: RNA pseudouridine synthase, partial [Betaproteobacteria bacterium]